MRGSFPAPHHHDPNETLLNFQIWVMVVFLSPVTAGERLRDQRFLRAGVRLRYQRLQTLRRPCYRLLRHRSVKVVGTCCTRPWRRCSFPNSVLEQLTGDPPCLGIKMQRIVKAPTDAWLATAGLRGGHTGGA